MELIVVPMMLIIMLSIADRSWYMKWWWCIYLFFIFLYFYSLKPNHGVNIGSMLSSLSFIGLFFYPLSYCYGRIVCGYEFLSSFSFLLMPTCYCYFSVRLNTHTTSKILLAKFS